VKSPRATAPSLAAPRAGAAAGPLHPGCVAGAWTLEPRRGAARGTFPKSTLPLRSVPVAVLALALASGYVVAELALHVALRSHVAARRSRARRAACPGPCALAVVRNSYAIRCSFSRVELYARERIERAESSQASQQPTCKLADPNVKANLKLRI
jgi:hypothetical protein